MRGNHTLMFLSLSFSLPIFLKINKIFKKMVQPSWKTDGQFLQKVKHKFTIQPSNCASRNLPKRNENVCLHKDMSLNVHSIIYETQNTPNVYPQQIDNHNVVYTYNILSIIKKNQLLTHDTTIDGPQKHYAT